MTVRETELAGVVLVEPTVYEDERGAFFELWRSDRAVHETFVQDNVSISGAGVIRGLHYQLRHPQAKLVSVLEGEIYDVAVDVRVGSPSFGKWVAARLSAANHLQMFIPAGFAHGFAVTSERAVVLYKCSRYYAPDDQYSVLWSDPALGIEWPVTTPLLSEKDRNAPTIADCGARGALPLG